MGNGKVWLIKPEGLYDTFETEDLDIDEWFEDDDEELNLKQSYRGWRFKSSK